MSKTITIPKKFGYPTMKITVNGKAHTVETGKEVTVDDAIAEVIENALKLEPKPGEAPAQENGVIIDSATGRSYRLQVRYKKLMLGEANE